MWVIQKPLTFQIVKESHLSLRSSTFWAHNAYGLMLSMFQAKHGLIEATCVVTKFECRSLTRIHGSPSMMVCPNCGWTQIPSVFQAKQRPMRMISILMQKRKSIRVAFWLYNINGQEYPHFRLNTDPSKQFALLKKPNADRQLWLSFQLQIQYIWSQIYKL